MCPFGEEVMRRVVTWGRGALRSGETTNSQSVIETRPLSTYSHTQLRG
jgi:hypothetical protein